MSFWVKFDDNVQWIVRFPMVGAIAPELVDEKLKTEVATMRFVSDKTTIPIPRLIGYGLTGNLRHPAGLPFLIMTHVPGKSLPFIWKELDNSAKNLINEQLADIALQLRLHPFDKVGALTLDDRDCWTLSNRPLTTDLASLQRDGIEIRMAPYYTSALAYFTDYFNHHRRRFLEQPNSTDDVSDAREKYAALSLFESLIPQFVNREYNGGPFVLCHGDLHQGNLLVDDELRIVAVLDWEWSCVLPIQVACLPPICLSPLKVENLALGEGRNEFIEAADCFLDHLSDREYAIVGDRTVSKTLQQMMSNGGYWFGLAIQDIYCFEYLFWDNLFPISHRLTEDEAIDTIFNSPQHPMADEIVRLKLQENIAYVNELEVLKVLAVS
jgi:hypothetical protein